MAEAATEAAMREEEARVAEKVRVGRAAAAMAAAAMAKAALGAEEREWATREALLGEATEEVATAAAVPVKVKVAEAMAAMAMMVAVNAAVKEGPRCARAETTTACAEPAR